MNLTPDKIRPLLVAAWFEKEGMALWRDLQKELDSTYEVVYFGKKRPSGEFYMALIEDFVAMRVPIEDFEKHFLKVFKQEPGGMNTELFAILNRFFSDVDAYSPDCLEGQKNQFEISEKQLRQRAKETLSDLQKYLKRDME